MVIASSCRPSRVSARLAVASGRGSSGDQRDRPAGRVQRLVRPGRATSRIRAIRIQPSAEPGRRPAPVPAARPPWPGRPARTARRPARRRSRSGPAGHVGAPARTAASAGRIARRDAVTAPATKSPVAGGARPLIDGSHRHHRHVRRRFRAELAKPAYPSRRGGRQPSAGPAVVVRLVGGHRRVGPDRERAERGHPRRRGGEPGAGRRQVGQPGQVLDDRDAGGEQQAVRGPLAAGVRGDVVDVDRVDADQRGTVLDQPGRAVPGQVRRVRPRTPACPNAGRRRCAAARPGRRRRGRPARPRRRRARRCRPCGPRRRAGRRAVPAAGRPGRCRRRSGGTGCPGRCRCCRPWRSGRWRTRCPRRSRRGSPPGSDAG